MKKLIMKIFDGLYQICLMLKKKIPADYVEYYKIKLQRNLFYFHAGLKGSEVQFQGKAEISDYKALIIGENVIIGKNTYFDSRGGIVIGDQTQIGQDCSFYTLDSTMKNYSDSIYIGKNVIIGNKVVLMSGAKIEDNQVVKSGTVVEKKVDFVASKKNDIENTDRGQGMFFIVSTGRSGSASIAEYLSQHPEITCLHEPRRVLIRLSTQYEYGELTYDEVVKELEYLYTKANVFPSGIYGESDQKLSNLILPLAQVFPNAKFIWLIRNGKKVVRSTTIRGWYDQEKENNAIDEFRGINKEGWKEFRLRGDKSHVFEEPEWKKMSAFEKNCWYWNYWNLRIESQFERLEKEKKHIIRLEDLFKESENLQDFIGVNDRISLELIHKNKVKKAHEKQNHFSWSEENKLSFDKICGALYSKYY